MKTENNEVMRYLAASVLRNPSFRQRIIDCVEAERCALAPEVDVDLQQLARLSYLVRSRDQRYNVIYFVVALVCGVIAALQLTLGVVIFILVSWGIHFIKTRDQMDKLIPLLRKESYDLAQLEQVLKTRYASESIARSIPDVEQNLVVYSGFSPFVGTGFPLGGWSFPITVNEPKEEMGQTLEIIPFTVAELYTAVEKGIEKCNFDGFGTRDLLFVNGTLIRDTRWILPSIHHDPVDCIDQQRVQTVMEGHDPLVRHYKWIYMNDWGHEITVSYFLRFSFAGAHLFIEANRFLLTPVAKSHRDIDTIMLPDLADWFGLLLSSLLVGPFAAIGGVFAVIGKIFEAFEEFDPFGFKERQKEKNIERSVHHDYGARTSIREQASSGAYDHYFQMLDKEMFVKVFEKQILLTIKEFLDAHNIDTSEFKERQTAILNNGVIVQGGELKAEALAVGIGAKSTKGGSQSAGKVDK